MKKSKENILITRSLSDESPIWQLSDDGHTVIAQSFIEITPVEITQIPDADVYFYYSKNAAKYFLQSANAQNIDLSNAQHAAMGNGTATVVKSFDIQPSFIGLESPDGIAQSLFAKYSNRTICFVRAQQSTLSIQKLWPSEYYEVIAYSITPKPIQLKEKIDTLFATSPMNLKSALECCDLKHLKRIVCIGTTTYKSAKALSQKQTILSLESSEQGMLNAYYSI